MKRKRPSSLPLIPVLLPKNKAQTRPSTRPFNPPSPSRSHPVNPRTSPRISDSVGSAITRRSRRIARSWSPLADGRGVTTLRRLLRMRGRGRGLGRVSRSFWRSGVWMGLVRHSLRDWELNLAMRDHADEASVDIDWEYPTAERVGGTPEGTACYTTMLQRPRSSY